MFLVFLGEWLARSSVDELAQTTMEESPMRIRGSTFQLPSPPNMTIKDDAFVAGIAAAARA
jgi:hypothetical protein